MTPYSVYRNSSKVQTLSNLHQPHWYLPDPMLSTNSKHSHNCPRQQWVQSIAIGNLHSEHFSQNGKVMGQLNAISTPLHLQPARSPVPHDVSSKRAFIKLSCVPLSASGYSTKGSSPRASCFVTTAWFRQIARYTRELNRDYIPTRPTPARCRHLRLLPHFASRDTIRSSWSEMRPFEPCESSYTARSAAPRVLVSALFTDTRAPSPTRSPSASTATSSILSSSPSS